MIFHYIRDHNSRAVLGGLFLYNPDAALDCQAEASWLSPFPQESFLPENTAQLLFLQVLLNRNINPT